MTPSDPDDLPEKVIKSEAFMDLGDKGRTLRSMRETIDFLLERQKYIGLLIVVVCVIDALNDGSQDRFEKFLERHFAELCRDLPARKFYEKYRNPIVHNFRLRKGYAIVENHEACGRYFYPSFKLEGTDRTFGGLNIDRFARDMMSYLDKEHKKLG